MIFSLLLLLNLVKATEIAVCISGQPSRFMPKLLAPLFEKNEQYNFKLFYKFENSSILKYSTDPSKRFDPSQYIHKNEEELKSAISEVYAVLPNVLVEGVTLVNPKTRKQWIEELKYPALNTIWQYAYIQENILNMYEKIKLCGETLREYESEKGMKFDYVISTREDIILMKDMDLDKLIPKIRKSATDPGCDILAKNCLTWKGINLRFWILSGTNGIEFLSSKIKYYKSLISSRRKIYNPESYDLAHLTSLNFVHCGISVNDFPVTAARHTYDGNYCFIDAEISNCIPSGLERIINSKRC